MSMTWILCKTFNELALILSYPVVYVLVSVFRYSDRYILGPPTHIVSLYLNSIIRGRESYFSNLSQLAIVFLIVMRVYSLRDSNQKGANSYLN